MNKKLIRVEIDRKKWYRGHENGTSSLRLRGGKQCCLGFACRVLGLRAKEILNKGMPSDLMIRNLDGLTNAAGLDTHFANKAAALNDRAGITGRQRERELKALAKENGFNFAFVG